MNTMTGASERKAGQVEDQVIRLTDQLGRTEEVVRRLIQALSPVLRDELNNKEPVVSAPEPCLVPLADTIRTLARGVEICAEKLEDMIRRLEL